MAETPQGGVVVLVAGSSLRRQCPAEVSGQRWRCSTPVSSLVDDVFVSRFTRSVPASAHDLSITLRFGSLGVST